MSRGPRTSQPLTQGRTGREGSRDPRGLRLLQLPHPQSPPHVLEWETPCLLSSPPERPPPEDARQKQQHLPGEGPRSPSRTAGRLEPSPGPRCGPARPASPAAGPPRGERRPPWASRAGPEGPSVLTATGEPRGGRDRGRHRSVHAGGRHPAGWVAMAPGQVGGHTARREGTDSGDRALRTAFVVPGWRRHLTRPRPTVPQIHASEPRPQTSV